MIARSTHCRYANAKDYQLYKNGKSIGVFKVNEKNEQDEIDELNSFIEMTGADQVVLIWTALKGHCHERVVI